MYPFLYLPIPRIVTRDNGLFRFHISLTILNLGPGWRSSQKPCSLSVPRGGLTMSISKKIRPSRPPVCKGGGIVQSMWIYSSTPSSSSANIFSTSRAAMQPLPALVIACLYFLSCTSPAANTPLTLVCVVPGTVKMYPSAST